MRWRLGMGPPLLLGLGIIACLGRNWSPAPRATSLRWEGILHDPALGDVHLVRHDSRPSRIILFVTGDGGWDDGAEDIAERLAGADAIVAGIDVEEWRQASAHAGYSCVDFADALGHLATRLRPEARSSTAPVILVGHSAGATIAYLALSQAPPRRFAGAVSMGFAPVLEFPTTPCAAAPFVAAQEKADQFRITPTAAGLHGEWWVLQGEVDDVTPASEAKPFANLVHAAHYVELQGQGHTFAGVPGWFPSVVTAMESLARDARARDVAAPHRGGRP